MQGKAERLSSQSSKDFMVLESLFATDVGWNYLPQVLLDPPGCSASVLSLACSLLGPSAGLCLDSMLCSAAAPCPGPSPCSIYQPYLLAFGVLADFVSWCYFPHRPRVLYHTDLSTINVLCPSAQVSTVLVPQFWPNFPICSLILWQGSSS